MMTPSRQSISSALILMAGAGSRLKGNGHSLPKPLVPLLGRPLISYLLESLARNGIKEIYAVVGYESGTIIAQTQMLVPPGLRIQFIENVEWRKQNGISVLAAAEHVSSPFLLTMSDHLFDDSLIRTLLDHADAGCINLAVDRKIDAIFDLDDAMKVQTQGERIMAIGKTLNDYNAIDTGLFVCGDDLFYYLNQAKKDGDCSLADGVRSAATEGKARAIDIGDDWWQDVDTPEMFAAAETKLRLRLQSSVTAASASSHG